MYPTLLQARQGPNVAACHPAQHVATNNQCITIDGLSVSLEGHLGKGGFGSVSKGKAHMRGELQDVAVKEITCNSAKERHQAQYEAKLQQQLSWFSNPSTRCACPAYYASDTHALSPYRSVVRIVMDRVHGVPIDEFTRDASRKRSYYDS